MRIPLFFPKLSVLGILRWDPGTWICLYISQVILMHNQVWCCFSSFPLISVQIAHHVTSETRPPPNLYWSSLTLVFFLLSHLLALSLTSWVMWTSCHLFKWPHSSYNKAFKHTVVSAWNALIQDLTNYSPQARIQPATCVCTACKLRMVFRF